MKYDKPDPESAQTAKALLDYFREPLTGEVRLSRERADRLEQEIADAIHNARG